MVPLLIAAAVAMPATDRCAVLATVFIEHATMERAMRLAGGGCRIDGQAAPVEGSHIRFELRLPPPERWSGRYYQIGNGGFAGAIHDPTLAEGEARGDAIAGTDTGHAGTGFDASWAKGHPVQVDDYGWRAIKATSDASRTLLGHYYGRPAKHRYAIGCSNGGRMALMAAARWPADWDGVIAGAPANPWTDQFRAFGLLQHQLRDAPGNWISPALLPAIRATALAQCPPGSVQNGIATRPQACGTDFDQMRCVPSHAGPCLSDGQMASLSAIVRAGYLPAAMIPADWQRWILASTRSDSQLTFATQAGPELLSAGDTLDVPIPGLLAFAARGGKILSYFGWSDAVVAPMRGLGWYRAVIRRTPPALRGSYRLFMVPGMTHCQDGEGPTRFGQSIDTPGLRDDRRHDVRRSIEAWVEQGQAPEIMIATDAAGTEMRRIRPLSETFAIPGNFFGANISAWVDEPDGRRSESLPKAGNDGHWR